MPRRSERGGLGRRAGLACTPTLVRAGLARAPIPETGLARGPSIVGGALAPPCTSHGDTARPERRPSPPRSERLYAL
jgi:hypothetical protein